MFQQMKPSRSIGFLKICESSLKKKKDKETKKKKDSASHYVTKDYIVSGNLPKFLRAGRGQTLVPLW